MNNKYFNFSLNIYKQIIQTDYIFYGIPHHGNAGDMMILQSELDLLEQINHQCLLYGNQYEYKKIGVNNKIILISGSGSYGDADGNYINTFINKIIQDYNNNDILIFPSSMYWKNDKSIYQHIEVLKSHSGFIHLCCRDINSYNFAITYFGNIPNVKLYLLPDTVLTWDINDYIKKYNIQQPPTVSGTLYISRNDNEKNITYGNNVNLKQDWPTLNIDKYINKYKLYKNEDIWLNYIKNDILIDAINFILPYETIISDRMHGFVLSMLLHKKSILLDNSYHKCLSLYDTWIKNQYNNVNIIF